MKKATVRLFILIRVALRRMATGHMGLRLKVGEYNWPFKNKTNVLGTIYEQKLFAVSLYNRSVNSDVFHDWVENTLIPEFPKESVFVMDNATFHKRKDTQTLIK